MTDGVSDRSRRRMLTAILLERFGSPGEIAGAVVFLTADATYCTGSVLTVDGGYSC